jgi:hypothetical protein
MFISRITGRVLPLDTTRRPEPGRRPLLSLSALLLEVN